MIKIKEGCNEIDEFFSCDPETRKFLQENEGCEVFVHPTYKENLTIKVSRYEKTQAFIIPKTCIEEINQEGNRIEKTEIFIDNSARKYGAYIIFATICLLVLLYGYATTQKMSQKQTKKQETIQYKEEDKFDVITETIVFSEKTIDEEFRLQEKLNKQIDELINKRELSIERVRAYRQKQQEMYAKKLNLLIK